MKFHETRLEKNVPIRVDSEGYIEYVPTIEIQKTATMSIAEVESILKHHVKEHHGIVPKAINWGNVQSVEPVVTFEL